jgi:hypothetical protein
MSHGPEQLISEDDLTLSAAGERLILKCEQQNPDPTQLIPVLVSGDWYSRTEDEGRTARSVFPAYLRRSPVDGSIEFWNGFVQPWFTREVAERIVELQQELIVTEGDDDTESLRFDGDAIVVGVGGQYRDETPEPEREWRIEPHSFGDAPLYAIGHCYWTWQSLGATLSRDPFHAWLRERREAGEKLGSPAGNPKLLARFVLERSSR